MRFGHRLFALACVGVLGCSLTDPVSSAGPVGPIVPHPPTIPVPRLARLEPVGVPDSVTHVRDTIIVRVAGIDELGRPLAGAMVTARTSRDGVLEASTVATDSTGVATIHWAVGTHPGVDSVVVEADTLPRVVFSSRVLAGPVGQLLPVDTTRTANIGAALRPAVRALDRFGNAVPGAAITFLVESGSGAVRSAENRTDTLGVAVEDEWRLGTVVGTQTLIASAGAARVRIMATATALPPKLIHIILFGDSNTDQGFDGAASVEASYVSSDAARLAPDAPHGPHQLAYKLEAQAIPALTLRAINHGMAWTGTGSDYTPGGPSARAVVNGISRFDADVLGAGRPTWDAGMARPRVNAIAPGPDDFVYVSLGTNDKGVSQLTTAATLDNLAWMVDRWEAAGLQPSHFIITTLPPLGGHDMPAVNAGIRTLASARGLRLIDLSAYLSADDGETWRADSLNIGDNEHYAEPVRLWLAQQIALVVLRTESP